MAKTIKGSSKPSAKGDASVKAKALPAKVKMTAAKAPAKAAPKQKPKASAKPIVAAAKPTMSVQELQDRIEQLEQANSALTVLVTNALTEARAEIKTLQTEFEKSKAAPPVGEVVPTPADDPAPSPAIAAKTAAKPATKAKPQKKPIIKHGKV